jgi:poly-beta-1,6-N-acetyl-D-glucosamine synthase
MMKLLQNRHYTQGAFLVATLVAANFLNFLASAFLGRTLTLEQFGLFTLFNTLGYFLTIFMTSLSGLSNLQVSRAVVENKQSAANQYFKTVVRGTLTASIAATVVWLIASPVLRTVFHVDGLANFFIFAPIFTFGLLAAVYRGYLQGHFEFGLMAITTITEPAVKFGAALALVYLGYADWVLASIPLSLFATFVFAWAFARRHTAYAPDSTQEKIKFSKQFFAASVVSGLSTAAFMNLDLVIAKHYLSPVEAGEYALLSLVGKIIFFGSTLLNGFVISAISYSEGIKDKNHKAFYKLLAGCFALAVGSYLTIAIFGQYIIPFLFGEKSTGILAYADDYALASALFALTNFISSYHTAKGEYFISKVSFAFSLVMALGIIVMHDTIGEIVSVFLLSSVAFAMAIVSLHLISLIRSRARTRYYNDTAAVGMLDVSICIPSYNEEKNIGVLLDSLLNQKLNHIKVNKIIVVSSGSTDQTENIVNEYGKKDSRIMLLREHKRNGKASAINEYLKIVNDPIVVLQSADTIAHENAIENLCVPFLRDEKIGMTGGAPIPVNDKNTFLGYIIHSWWWFHRNIPRFGELVAYRNLLDQISPTTAVDEAYIQAKMVQMGYKVVHIDDAVVTNKGAETVRDLIKQRRRIFNGHSRLMEEENIRVTNMTKSSLFLLLFSFEMVKVKQVFWLVGGIGIEIWARILGMIDKYFYARNPFVWDVADSTKNISAKVKEESE